MIGLALVAATFLTTLPVLVALLWRWRRCKLIALYTVRPEWDKGVLPDNGGTTKRVPALKGKGANPGR